MARKTMTDYEVEQEMGITLENIEDQITRTDAALGEAEQQ